MRYRVEPQDAGALVGGGGTDRLAVDASRPTEAIAAWMNELRAGEAESGRAEPGVDCLFYVVTGLARAVVEGRECVAAAGDSFLVPANQAYILSNAGKLDLLALEMQLPSRSERLEGYADTCSENGPARRGEE